MTTMENDIWRALRARVEGLVLDPVHTVSWPNEAFEQPVVDGLPGPWLEVRHLPNDTERLFLRGGDPAFYQGILQLGLHSPVNQRYEVTTEHAGQVAAHFPADLKMTAGAARVRVSRHPSIARGFRDDATGLWVTPITVRYHCEI